MLSSSGMMALDRRGHKRLSSNSDQRVINALERLEGRSEHLRQRPSIAADLMVPNFFGRTGASTQLEMSPSPCLERNVATSKPPVTLLELV